MAMTRDPDMERDPRLAATYRAGAREEPPERLDDAIRAAARREAGAGPGRVGALRFRNWGVPLGLAAVVVLSVTMVMMMREEGAGRWETVAPPAGPVPADVALRDDARTSATAPDAAAVRKSATPPGAAAPAEMAKVVPERAPQPLQQPAAQLEQRAPASAASRAKAEAAEAVREEAGAAAPADRMPTVPAVPPPLPRSPAAADQASGAGPAARSAATPAAALSAVSAEGALWQDLAGQPPEKWRARITELSRAGRSADAAALIGEFRHRFPDEPLPEGPR